MAEFFDSKQGVLDIEVTEWGKYLLSRGKFTPKYYSFSDDEVLYDSRTTGITSEEQKEIENRVLNETPYLKMNTRLKEAKDYFEEYDRSVEEEVPAYSNPLDSMTEIEIKSKVEKMSNSVRFSQDARAKEFLVRSQLGTVRTQTSKTPRFNITMLRSEFTSVRSTTRNTNYGIVRIPQLNVNLEQDVGVLYDIVSNFDSPDANSFNSRSSFIKPNGITSIGSNLFPDRTYLVTNPKFIALDLSEDNVEYDNINFKIEVFEIINEDTLELKQLKMITSPEVVNEDGYLLEDAEAMKLSSLVVDAQSNPDPDSVDYYFSLQLDSQIPKDTICGLVGNLQHKGYNFKLNYDIDCGVIKPNSYSNQPIQDFNNGTSTSVVTPASNCSDGGGECL